MSLQNKVMEAMKLAMKSKDTTALEALRAIKSAILLANTQSGAKETLEESAEVALLQKLVKQRKDSAAIYTEQGREELASAELAQASVIAQFLPEQLSESELIKIIEEAIAKTGAQGMKDMGTVMGMVVKAVAGRADGKTIADKVRQKLM
ncbi:MAG: GatB/YqeY domain-containing protein [Bacteroidota bacterium]